MAIKCAIPRLKCDLKFGLPVLAVLGIIYSEWATSFIIDALRISDFDSCHGDTFLIRPMMNTYYLLSIATSIMLYFGFKNTNNKLILYWRLLKFAESGFIIIGVFIFFYYSSRWYWYWFYHPIAVVLLGCGWYLIYTVQKGYNEFGTEVETVTVSNLFENIKCQDSPPPYEENTAENFNPQVADALSFLGYIKLFEFIMIVPVLVLIIRSPVNFEYYNYWKIFWLLAGLGICSILYVRFICQIILIKTKCDNLEEEEEEEELLTESKESTST